MYESVVVGRTISTSRFYDILCRNIDEFRIKEPYTKEDILSYNTEGVKFYILENVISHPRFEIFVEPSGIFIGKIVDTDEKRNKYTVGYCINSSININEINNELDELGFTEE